MRTKHQLIMDSAHDPIARYLLENDDRPWYIPDATRDFLIRKFLSTCAICRKITTDLHIDHVHPVSAGGTCILDNLQVLCRTCNLCKSNHLLDPRSYALGYPIPIYVESERQIAQKVVEKLFDEMA